MTSPHRQPGGSVPQPRCSPYREAASKRAYSGRSARPLSLISPSPRHRLSAGVKTAFAAALAAALPAAATKREYSFSSAGALSHTMFTRRQTEYSTSPASNPLITAGKTEFHGQEPEGICSGNRGNMTGTQQGIHIAIRRRQQSPQSRFGAFEQTEHRKIVQIAFGGVQHTDGGARSGGLKSYAQKYHFPVGI